MKNKDKSRDHFDPVTPGEQFFCYWKTSAPLWEQKIKELPSHQVIFVPLYWGLHAISESSWDFGQQAPERDLARLIYLLTQHNRHFVWILPLGPAPYMPNGGVPIFTARTLSVSEKGLMLACFNSEGGIHKTYSFYGQSIAKSFSSFVLAFGNFLAEIKSQAPVWAHSYMYLNDQEAHSFLEDHSVAFEQGFSKYLKQRFPGNLDLTSTNKESELKREFTQEVSNLFTAIAQDSLAPYWSGKKEIVLIGAGPTDTLERGLSGKKPLTHIFQDIFRCYLKGDWFSTALLNPDEKNEILVDCLNEHFGMHEIDYQYGFRRTGQLSSLDLEPCCLVEVLTGSSDSFIVNGLLGFLEKKYRWIYSLRNQINFSSEELKKSEGRVRIFCAKGMDRTHFSQMLKLFLMGERIIFDNSEIEVELSRRLQVFFLENSLKIQIVNFVTEVSLCELGDGRFIMFDGKKISDFKKQESFWRQLFNYLNLIHPQLVSDQDIFAMWRMRASNSQELNYLDVRRLNLYNPTSYKKIVSIFTLKKFAYLRSQNLISSQIKTTPEAVEVELLPGGRVAMDFGHYQDI